MTITERARQDGIPETTAREAARRVGVTSGRPITIEEWDRVKAAITDLNTRPRPVIGTDENGEQHHFPSVRAAAKACNTYPASIRNCCFGSQKSAGGMTWELEDD